MLDLKDTLASVPLDDQDRQKMFEAEVRKRDLEPEVFDVQTPLLETMPVRNVRVSIPGQNQTDDPFYVTAHHDCVKAGRGVVDNWSGVVALLELIDRLNDRPLNRPVRMMSFAYEEAGLYGFAVGSGHYLRFNCNEQVFANVNLECLGPSPLRFWTYDAHLVPGDIPESPYWGMPSDAMRFHQHGHRSITFDGISASAGQIIHTERDNIDAINMDHYKKSLDQIEGFLRYLDTEGCGGPAQRHGLAAKYRDQTRLSAQVAEPMDRMQPGGGWKPDRFDQPARTDVFSRATPSAWAAAYNRPAAY